MTIDDTKTFFIGLNVTEYKVHDQLIADQADSEESSTQQPFMETSPAENSHAGSHIYSTNGPVADQSGGE